MWLLMPLARSGGASQRPSDSAATAAPVASAPTSQQQQTASSPNPVFFLVGPGPLTLGRAGAGVDVDIPIQGDGSVSGRHATIELRPAEGEDGASGGATTVVVLTGAREMQ